MSWIETYTGKPFDPLAPTSAAIDIEDIAHALAMTCRFNGHCHSFYSVAEHCIWVSRQVDQELALAGLLHDAAEAYVSDVGHPVKSAMAGFSNIERDILDAVAERFGLPRGFERGVREVDLRMLATEKDQLMKNGSTPWPVLENVPPYPLTLSCWSPKEARKRFTERFSDLHSAL